MTRRSFSSATESVIITDELTRSLNRRRRVYTQAPSPGPRWGRPKGLHYMNGCPADDGRSLALSPQPWRVPQKPGIPVTDAGLAVGVAVTGARVAAGVC